jgi:hypothetical protein
MIFITIPFCAALSVLILSISTAKALPAKRTLNSRSFLFRGRPSTLLGKPYSFRRRDPVWNLGDEGGGLAFQRRTLGFPLLRKRANFLSHQVQNPIPSSSIDTPAKSIPTLNVTSSATRPHTTIATHTKDSEGRKTPKGKARRKDKNT